jgi:hypothetical protein
MQSAVWIIDYVMTYGNFAAIFWIVKIIHACQHATSSRFFPCQCIYRTYFHWARSWTISPLLDELCQKSGKK